MTAHFVSPTVRAAYADKTVEEMKWLLSMTELNGKAAKQAMEAGGSPNVTYAVVYGRRVDVSAAERTYNTCRGNWKDIAALLEERGVSVR